MKQYAFILGRHPALSVAELIRTVPGIKIAGIAEEACMAACAELAPGFLNRLGGTIKIAEEVRAVDSLTAINADVLRSLLPPRDGRVIFGISIHGNVSAHERREIYLQGLELKKLLKAEGRRARYVVSKEKQLSSVVVTKNKLIQEGAEFLVVKGPDGVSLCRTIAVQEFESYGERDFDRPGRSARRGMLPPKLAQMMINISGAHRSRPLLDPFCGSGTVLGEALLLGFQEVIGADIEGEAARDTTAYLEWLTSRHSEFSGRWRVFQSDVRMMPERLTAPTGAIVTETYLGPPQSGRETPAALERVMREQLLPLYRDALAVFARLLAPGGSAVVAFPIYGKDHATHYVPLAEIAGALKIEPLIPAEYAGLKLPLTPSGGCRYERPDQHVGREIVLLRRA